MSLAFLKIQDVGLSPISGSGVLSVLGPGAQAWALACPDLPEFSSLWGGICVHRALCTSETHCPEPQTHPFPTAWLQGQQLPCYGKPLA